MLMTSHGLDFGISALFLGAEGAALYGASRCKEGTKKYTLVAIAVIAALAATLAGSIAVGGALLATSGLQAAQAGSLGTALLALVAHVQAFISTLTPAETPRDKTP